MENNLYYTPELEEFHVGFEIELLNIENSQWGKYTITESDLLDATHYESSALKHILEDEYRVKYLDREDIESLGWDYDLDSIGRCEYKDYMLYNFNNSNIFTIKAKRGFVKYGQAFVSFDVLFEGIIKNKSELKKLMKQLNIL